METHTEQLKSCNTIKDIVFPIFGIANFREKIFTEDNIVYIKTASGTYILDNRNLHGETLGMRRLRITSPKKYIPRAVLHTIPQMIKSKYSTFIDNKGKIFKYVKTETVKLKYYKVKEVLRHKTGCVLILSKIDYPVQVACSEAYGIGYVGLLHTKQGLLEYEFSEQKKSDTWRKI